MVETSMNIFDLGVLIIIGLSALLSFFRGFAREVLSLGAWIAASVITLYTFQRVAVWIEPQVKSKEVASGLASIGVFVIALVVISIFTRILGKFIKSGSEVGMLDNLVGLAFGAARGALIVAIGYYMYTLTVEENQYPEWLNQAQSRPYVARAANWIHRVAPDYIEAISSPVEEKKKRVKLLKEKAEDHTPALREMTIDAPSFEELQRRVREENEKN